ncbi:SGNH/GDSL hydrolase family protein [Oceanomicrobium pacificus]|uniref:SGNH hydrolase-type esterase domain-containing protein n=1 Tax=Oceanomicrobium pacificus TaxID=2692916 RepID=A0A6B0TTZ5_9RHOB|nr:SGNH/GDSL hydrolase family protein [Oceanomicrobium pacificus]MXU66259.1 hypothetical protein [Oceanomicrobium pacificus]
MTHIGLSTGVRGGQPRAGSFSRLTQILGARDGVAISFIDDRMLVQDATKPANNRSGAASALLTRLGSDPWLTEPGQGVRLDPARDFGLALDTAGLPWRADALHVYARFTPFSADPDEQRYVLLADNSGNDRFAAYTTPGVNLRFATGDGSAADTNISGTPWVPGVEQELFFGCDAFGKSFVDTGGIWADETTTLAMGPVTTIGIGGYGNQVLRVLDGILSELVLICEPLPRIRRLQLPPVPALFLAEGDSHTFNVSYGLAASEFYPAQAVAGRAGRVVAVNVGGSGDSSAEMVAQLPALLADGVPDFATIYAGSNDGAMVIEAAPVPTDTVLHVSAAEAGRLAVGGHVSVAGAVREIADLSGGQVTLASPLPAAPQANDLLAPDTQANIEAWIDAVQAAGCARVLVIGAHYLNFANGGDTLATEQPLRAGIRAAERAAAQSRGCPYLDLYAGMRDMVTGGDVTAGDDLSWHVAVGDTHLNAAGEAAIGTLLAQELAALGW